MVVAGNVKTEQIRALAEKWFSPIVKGERIERKLPKEPIQKEAKRLEVERAVPLDAIYISFHMCGKEDADYAGWDLLSDVLGHGDSSRLHQQLVKENRIFTSISAFVMGERDPSLFTIAGHLLQGITIDEAEKAIWTEIELLRTKTVADIELEKVKNQVESTHEFSEMNILNRAIGLAYHELLGDAEMVNTEIERYRKVTKTGMLKLAQQHLVSTNSSTLIYKRKG